MAKQKPYGGVFEGIEFPDYEYQHYPLMMVNAATKESRVVNDEQEEKEAEEEGFKSNSVGPQTVVSSADIEALKVAKLESDKDLAEAEAEVANLKAQLAALKGK